MGLITNNDDSSYINNLTLNTSKTKEMVVDFRSKNKKMLHPLAIKDQAVDWVDSFRLIWTTISSNHKWNTNVSHIVKKAYQRLFFLRLKNVVSKAGMLQLYRAREYPNFLYHCVGG